jgi:hypothetical protein
MRMYVKQDVSIIGRGLDPFCRLLIFFNLIFQFYDRNVCQAGCVDFRDYRKITSPCPRLIG